MASQRGQLEVTMHVYSGRPNPTWTIDEDLDDPDLQFEGLKRQAKLQPERLGYRGFTVKRKETGIPPPVPTVLERAAPTTAMAVDTTAGLPGPSEDLSIVDVPQLEQKLLNTSKELSSTLKNYVSSCLSTPYVARSAPVTLESAPPRRLEELPRELLEEVKHAPPFEPSKWNNMVHQPFNNCFNYGNNMITDSFAQPGRAAGQKFENITGPEVKKAAQADGLKAEAEREWNRVALVIWPYMDYHWYRLDNTGTWSHKPGQTPAIDTDNSGNKITDPESCDRGPYSEFTCYMWTHPDKVKIK